jgi:catechol 2,3-dioxygenase
MDQPSGSESLPAETRVGRTALRVSALDEQMDFYRRVVGLAVLERSATRAVLGAGGEPLLVLEAAPDAPARRRDASGLYHNAFRVPTRSALGDALGRIREHWQLDGATDHRVSEALYCSDPEGNGVEVYRDYPRGEWPWTDDERVRMTNDRLDVDGLEGAATGSERVPPGTDVGHVHLEVSSLGMVEDFYVDTLGFEVMATYQGALFVAAGGYHHHVGANTWHRRSREAAGRGLAWFELVVPDGEALETVLDRLGDHGVDQLAEPGEGYAVMDPDGIEIRLRTER